MSADKVKQVLTVVGSSRQVKHWKPTALSRRCGTCDRCCEVLPIIDLDLLAGERCQHMCEGGGCGIYDSPDKPLVCSTYACLWLAGKGTLDQRPDRMGACPTMSDNGKFHSLYMDPGVTPDTISRAMRAWIRSEHRKTDRPVLLLWGEYYGTTTIMWPDGTREDRDTDWIGPLAERLRAKQEERNDDDNG